MAAKMILFAVVKSNEASIEDGQCFLFLLQGQSMLLRQNVYCPLSATMSSRLKPETFDWAAAHAFEEWEHDLKIIENHGKEMKDAPPLSQKHAVQSDVESDEEYEFGKEEPAKKGAKKPAPKPAPKPAAGKKPKPLTPSDYGFKVVTVTDLVPSGFPQYPRGTPEFRDGSDTPLYRGDAGFGERPTNSPHRPVALNYKEVKKEELPAIAPCRYCEQYPCYMIQDLVGGSLMMTGDMMKDEGFENKVIRKALYKEAARMIFGRLGAGKRRPLPVCVEGEIKDTWPRNAAKDDEYMWYKEN
ncbi:expressed unknown protein [Seminavis robusta]|uniref:Uncharacterized protein n=1 Tax=Seminavis robusta TaxID=568900 RepID=A0A9N8HUW0_9STRA|nr:expressed unknown protein [Seminavis robusta]|eukprot:Sro1705_g292420.1 n/a (299) ;mRNA; r:5286-6182